jgi:hypothetical protein
MVFVADGVKRNQETRHSRWHTRLAQDFSGGHRRQARQQDNGAAAAKSNFFRNPDKD